MADHRDRSTPDPADDREDLLFFAHAPLPQPETGVDGGPPSGDPARRSAPRAGDPVKQRRGGGAGSFLKELPLLLLVAFLLAFVLRTFVLQVFFIPSSSMEPTLQIDDRMVVEKITYRFREPRRGEVAVFEGETFGQVDPDATVGERFVRGFGQFLGLVPANARDFVKRIIGLPGDEILIEGGQVFVNGVPIDEPYVVFDDLSDYGPVTVPDGRLFFLGDNRPNSSDSRRSLGFVPTDHLVGRSAFVIWPFDNAASLMTYGHDLESSTDPAVDDPAVGDPDDAEAMLVPAGRGN